MKQYLIRFVVGGLMVSAFRSRRGCSSSEKLCWTFWRGTLHAIATLLIALLKQGPSYIAIEGRSMILGGAALAAYSFVSCQLLKRCQFSGLISTLLSTVVWFASAVGRYWLLLKET